ncbi:MAG: M67 family metallopeptidase [Rhodospirillaceae bacterium]|nr:M67 family metallopeptidase [Rhodospirillaceae bacterium]
MIRIPENFLDIIKAEAEAAFPNECCGLLAGTVNDDNILITKVVPSPNALVDDNGSGHKNFEIDPKIHFDLLHELKDKAENIIGHYHSHPGQPAEPSMHDINNAFEADHVWFIISVDENGAAKDLGAFRIDNKTRKVAKVKFIEN